MQNEKEKNKTNKKQILMRRIGLYKAHQKLLKDNNLFKNEIEKLEKELKAV